MRVLVIDDDPTILMMLKRLFETRNGLEVFAFASEREVRDVPFSQLERAQLAIIDGLNGQASEVEAYLLRLNPEMETICFSGDEKPEGFRGSFVAKPSIPALFREMERIRSV